MGDDGASSRAQDDAELRSQLAAIVESSADAIIGKTLDGVITSWNAGAADMYGYAASEMIGRDISVLFPPGRADELAPILQRLRRGERVGHFETRRVRKDGTIAEVSVAVSPIRDASGTVTGAATVARDITEHNHAAAERRAHEAQMDQAERMETVGQLAGGIAHDFNNLLGAIMGFAQLAAEEAADRPALRSDIEQILSTAERAARLTRELLIFSRREPDQPERADLNAIITGIRSLLAASVGQHITQRFELAPDLPAVVADRGRFEQLLLNLSVNARDAMPDGGTLTIATRDTELAQPPARVLGNQIAPGRYAEVTVSDTGTGMSPEVVRRIFEPFFTTKAPDHGTGLGLSTVYGIVAQAGGGISVDSAEGAGTTFHVYLPALSVPATPAPAPAASPAGTQGNGETVLVVDDEPAVLQAAVRILRRNGYTTMQASTGEQALSLLSTHDVQLLLTDSIMPGMTGLTLAGRATALRPGLRVLHMSGHTPPALAEGHEEFIMKPFTAEALLHKVHAMLGHLQPGNPPPVMAADR